MKKYLYIFMMSLFAALPAMAQDVITGTVTETIGGMDEPCIGVNVTFVNAQNRIVVGTVTDFSGIYSLKVPAGADKLTLQFSYIGMKTQKFKYTGQTTLDVKLEPDNQQTQLAEVKVTGSRGGRNDMGVNVREQAFATQKIKMDQILETAPVTSVEEALQGQLGGVDIIAAGDPGAKSSIRIRGTATLNSNADPLIVIDGVPYSTDIDDSFDFNTASQEDFAQMLSLNPNDIESIEVLKDAASTAIYGTKGANGVLLITKKKGTRSKPRFTFSTKNSLKVEPKSMPMLNGDQYTAMIQDALWNTINAKGVSASAAELDLLSNTREIGSSIWPYADEYSQNIDWLDYVKKNAFTTDNSFSMSGGGEKANYRFSLSYMDEGGTSKGTGLSRLTTSLNVGYNFSEKLHVEAEYSYSDTDKDSPYTDNVRAAATVKMPNKSPYYIRNGQMSDIYFTRQSADEFQGSYLGTSKANCNTAYNFHPIIMAEDSYKELSTKEQKMTVRARWYVIPELLTYNGYVSMKFNTSKTDTWLPQAATGLDYSLLEKMDAGNKNWQSINQAGEAYSNSFSLQTENKLMLRKNWDDIHNLVVTGIWYTSQSRSSNWAAYRCGVASPEMVDISVGSGYLYSQGSGKSEVTSLSARGSLAYTLLNRYTINGTFNYEGKSSLGKDNRWGFFPSVGASWQVQDEPFMKKFKEDFLTQWKIRASWGMSGNAPGGTSPYVGTYTALGYYMDNAAVTSLTAQLNKLKWETSREVDLGTDINLWDGKLTFTFDWYRKNTKDLLQKSVRVPYSVGYVNTQSAYDGRYAMSYINSGEIRNEGWEARIEYRPIKTKKWDLSLNFNISRNENTIVELPENVNEESFTLGNGVKSYAQKLVAGTSVGSFFGFRYLGVYQNTYDTYAKDAEGRVMYDLVGNPIIMNNGNKYTCYPGDAKYEDINHDGVIDKNDLVYLGNSNPMLSGGGGFTLKYDRLSLTVFLHYRLGQKIINQARMDSEGMYNGNNQSTAVLRRWRNEGDNTDIPRALWNYGYNQLGSDRYVEDCSFLRFKTISLSYNLPKKFCQNIGLTSANVFFTAYDLFTITDYTGLDPEVSLPSSITAIARDNSQTPRSKRFSMGVTVNF